MALLAGLFLAGAAHAAEQPAPATAAPAELKLLAQYPVDGMNAGNLSGLARCAGEWLAVSDHDDDRYYRLLPGTAAWQAEAELFSAPPAPASNLPWGLRVRTWTANLLRGGDLDFEDIACDNAGNRYLLSEANAAVLQLPLAGQPEWLHLPASLTRQARASGMLLHYNALLEGIAIEPNGTRLWLAAERERRGLLVLHQKNGGWQCTGGCVLLSEAGRERSPLTPDSQQTYPRDFSALTFFDGKLFSLERLAHRLCRRTLGSGAVEKCWSFAAEASLDSRRYPEPYGTAEALWLEADGLWLGLDNNGQARGDGEQRPLLWHFAAPSGGWSAP
ncbi:DNA topoisomerase IV [Pseudomonas alcaligenes]|uniref:DNA topoisomerase IV n=1 Tax=Aquipseudomonas alcaligenes TaxID=43263 RepID=A0ABR7S448_AQUAC|nr:esterase-like activity of phytase family protein [Pseudomonas alcaligenes]MBC9252326.1 DNA topoisomerase IV [Pseudomonas alcaligenes]